MPLALAILFTTGSMLLLMPADQEKQQIAAFHQRCSNQGGTVLHSYQPDGSGWIGCYKGLTEIPNE